MIKIFNKSIYILVIFCQLFSYASAKNKNPVADTLPLPTQTQEGIEQTLGWKNTEENRCHGYYLQPAISSLENQSNPNLVQIISDQFLYSFKGTSESQGKITIRRYGQEITADKAYLYRNNVTGKLKSGVIDLFGNVTLRENNTLVVAERGQFNFQTKAPTLLDVLYRTTVYSDSIGKKSASPTPEELETQQKIYQLTAWGKADSYGQTQPRISVMDNASYSTCPPNQSAWKVQASHVELNKITGRGTATHARLYVKDVPVFYTPYLNFPIDSRRQTGFLWPKVGASGKLGPNLSTPFYWNIAPNYDMTITPTALAKRGVQITDFFRYLTPERDGHIKIAVLPYDRAFAAFQKASEQDTVYTSSSNPKVQAELRRLLNAGTTRSSFIWVDNAQYNNHWTSNIDYNYVSDDYYLSDLVTSVNEVTQNQLMQKAETTYKDEYWNFTGRLQNYQTLHPINTQDITIDNQYSKFPQLLLGVNYPNEKTGIEYGISNELTRFDFRNTPGDVSKMAMGDRINIQPSISRPYNMPYLSIVPRLQFAMTKYELGHVTNTQSKTPGRALPIVDISSGLNFDRDLSIFDRKFTQTLEPQIYYTYIPYRNQNDLPIFDTTVNQLTYDQLFTYNRFSGIDRIGDANQVAVGMISRIVDQQSGYEKIRAGIGQIYYFKDRLVNACTTPLCLEELANSNINNRNRSPISGLLNYNMNPSWSLQTTAIWDPLIKTGKLVNQTTALHYQPDSRHIINLAYTFQKNGDRRYPDQIDLSSNNLSQTDLSTAWPLTRDFSGVARWTQNLNRRSFQNLLFGVQYDSCCWAVRLVAGKQFVGVNPDNNQLQYDSMAILQFALKGLGNFGTGDPTQLLVNSVSGYSSQFGQDY